MRCRWWAALVLAGSIVGVAFAAGESEELERNRRLLERWRADPDHYARLQRDLRAFYALPRPRQQQLRDLDQQLHDADGVTQTHLGAVLERYNTWLETLTEDQRGHILHAPDEATRLARIREQRLREWLPRLPTGDQKAVTALPLEQQIDRIAALRFEERRQRSAWRHEWDAVKKAIPKPTRIGELPAETRAFVQKSLLKHLTPEDHSSLTELEGKYPEWLRRLQDLADAHPVLPPLPSGEVKTFDDVTKLPGMEKLKKGKYVAIKLKGQWPEYALAFRRSAGEKHIPPLGASRPSEFPAETQKFLTQKLIPALGTNPKANLKSLEGKWPDYPLMLHRLAREKRLVIPGMSLPGPIEMWEYARTEAALRPKLGIGTASHSPTRERGWVGMTEPDARARGVPQ